VGPTVLLIRGTCGRSKGDLHTVWNDDASGAPQNLKAHCRDQTLQTARESLMEELSWCSKERVQSQGSCSRTWGDVAGSGDFGKVCHGDSMPFPMSVPLKYFITGPNVRRHFKWEGKTLFPGLKFSGSLDSVPAQVWERVSVNRSDLSWKAPVIINAA